MNLRPLLLLCGLALAAGAGARAADAARSPEDVARELATRVIILANSADADSVAIAHHYAEQRGVPEANIIALKLALTEGVSRTEFETTLYEPLQDELVKRGWITGFPFTPPVAGAAVVPHRKYAIIGHRIAYLVICRGVPLRVDHDAALPLDSSIARRNTSFTTNGAAVDGELALLPQSGWPMSGFVPNPLFRNDRPDSFMEGQVVKVSRLDGPTAADARGLVDLALAAEAAGLVGRGYIDIGGPHAEGDQWLEAAVKELAALGFDRDVDRDAHTLPPEARFDAPALYFGWYESKVNGPFTRPGFRFPPGAIALHIYSYSASTLHGGDPAWVPNLVAHGVTATFGNVSEPFLQFTHEPQLLLHALARGDTLGDAAAYALPGYSWMAILIGDPLYRPFKKPFEEQWRDRAKLPPEQLPYLVLRQMRLLEAAGKRAEAVAAGREAQRDSFSLPVALTLAELLRAAGDNAGARRALTPCLAPDLKLKTGDAPLLAAVARQFEALGEAKLALQAWQFLLTGQVLAGDLRPAWLKPAVAAARAAKDSAQALRWEGEIKEVAAAAKP